MLKELAKPTELCYYRLMSEKIKIIPLRPRKVHVPRTKLEDGYRLRVQRMLCAGLEEAKWVKFLNDERKRLLAGDKLIGELGLGIDISRPLGRDNIYTIGGLIQIYEIGGRPWRIGPIRRQRIDSVLGVYQDVERDPLEPVSIEDRKLRKLILQKIDFNL